MTDRRRRDAATRYGGPAFVGGILVGVALGILLGDFGAWFPIGIGAGFILMAFIAAIGK